MEKENALDLYVLKRAQDAGCSGIPISDMYTKEEWDMIGDVANKNCAIAIFYALVIGFANGIEYEKALPK